ncbi:Beta-hexosaminidase [Vibrio stylophorae]|uniref:beta-N-acetylhexosaminidase n=1 Tax=Vibrio stylophorae TaxID=659351 RepID=A0ABM8ZQM5_9VIBR|nr:beta-N-acetylhexosaminidase [Vibrio stylophorae]CAH0532573.1 Beta-hexosaminidase [Vibrio stylophorae]
MSYRVDLTVLSENATHSTLALTLHNLSDTTLIDWQLHFSYSRYIDPAELSGALVSQVGSYCCFKPTAQPSLLPNGHYCIKFTVRTEPFRYHTHGIGDAYLTIGNDSTPIPAEVTPLDIGTVTHRDDEVLSPGVRDINVIPKPQLQIAKAGILPLNATVAIASCADAADAAATWLAEELSQHIGEPIRLATQGQILFQYSTSLAKGAYQLDITTSKVVILAADAGGFHSAAATLLQLVNSTPAHGKNNGFFLPCVEIKDAPRFVYRGMMLDCARHFHPVSRVKRLINQLAHYKFNYFHWHLTDDEGWRLEIKAYPELTEIGAWRGPHEVMEPQYSLLSQRHGGYYSQQEVREIIAYASARGITVIPEIDVPGHSRAAIKSLPELLVDAEDKSQYRSIQWFEDNILSPGLATTYEFLDTVIDEVCELFPSPFIHVGADEVPQGVWTDSPACKAMMDEHGYSDPKELQGHMLRYLEQKIQAKGRRMMGWEEATKGDKVSEDTIIFSWLSEEAGLACAKKGFDVVMQPGQFTYLDMAQGYQPSEPGADWACPAPLRHVYSYEPLADLPASDPVRAHILGVQAALWCEFVNNQSRLDFMLFPRLIALSEVCWTENKQRNWDDFLARLNGQLPWLDRQGINYRPL